MAVLILSILFVFQLAACGKTPTPDDDKEQTTYFTIRFNTNGGTSVKSIKIKKGEAITLPDSPTKEGYIFDGWYLDSSCVEALEEGYLVKKSITLYAKWKEATKPVEDYQVIFYVDGEVYFQATLKSGAVLTLPKTPTKKGYVFDGWYFDSDFLQAVNDNYVIIGNVSIYAKWKTAQASEECEHEPIADKGYSPTCTKQGLSDGTHCDKCGKVLVEQEEIPAIGHSLERHEAKAATCTEIGWEAYDTCKRDGCEYTTYAEIPALNHDIEHHEAKAATCTEIGWDAYDTCKRDGCEYTTYAEIPPHSFDKNGVCSVCGYSETGLTFTLNKDGKSYSISGIGTFTGTDLVIPKANFDTKPVTSIGNYAFSGCSGLTNITIPDSVTSIGNGAFYGCTGLTSVTIGNSVTSIGIYAFYGCSGLTSMILPFVGASKTASDRYDQVFGYIFGYTTTGSSSSSVSGATYQYYGGKYYYYYIPSSLKSVTITGGEIPSCAFYNCSGLTSVAIPDGVTSIGGEAFKNCSGLTSITIPDSVTSIGVAAFRNCSGLTSITIPDSETSIGGSAFEDCSGLTSIIIPNSVTSIGNFAFWNCSGLTTVFYAGTEEQWKAVSIGFNNSSLTNATIVYSSDGAERTYSFVTNCDQSVDSVNATHLASLPTLTKDGYHFCGWYDNEAFEGKAVSALYCSKEKTTLYAKWLTEEEWNALKDGTTFAKAYVAESGQTYDVTITTGGQIVYFAFTPTTSGSFTIQSTGSGQRIVNTLYSSTKSFLSNINDGDGKNFKLTYTMTAGTTYYIAVKFYGSSTTGTFKVSFS